MHLSPWSKDDQHKNKQTKSENFGEPGIIQPSDPSSFLSIKDFKYKYLKSMSRFVEVTCGGSTGH